MLSYFAVNKLGEGGKMETVEGGLPDGQSNLDMLDIDDLFSLRNTIISKFQKKYSEMMDKLVRLKTERKLTLEAKGRLHFELTHLESITSSKMSHLANLLHQSRAPGFTSAGFTQMMIASDSAQRMLGAVANGMAGEGPAYEQAVQVHEAMRDVGRKSQELETSSESVRTFDLQISELENHLAKYRTIAAESGMTNADVPVKSNPVSGSSDKIYNATPGVHSAEVAVPDRSASLWSCSRCTFDNEAVAEQCEMCNFPSPTARVDTSSSRSSMSSAGDREISDRPCGCRRCQSQACAAARRARSQPDEESEVWEDCDEEDDDDEDDDGILSSMAAITGMQGMVPISASFMQHMSIAMRGGRNMFQGSGRGGRPVTGGRGRGARTSAPTARQAPSTGGIATAVAPLASLLSSSPVRGFQERQERSAARRVAAALESTADSSNEIPVLVSDMSSDDDVPDLVRDSSSDDDVLPPASVRASAPAAIPSVAPPVRFNAATLSVSGVTASIDETAPTSKRKAAEIGRSESFQPGQTPSARPAPVSDAFEPGVSRPQQPFPSIFGSSAPTGPNAAPSRSDETGERSGECKTS